MIFNRYARICYSEWGFSRIAITRYGRRFENFYGMTRAEGHGKYLTPSSLERIKRLFPYMELTHFSKIQNVNMGKATFYMYEIDGRV